LSFNPRELIGSASGAQQADEELPRMGFFQHLEELRRRLIVSLLAVFLGFEVVSKVSTILHTPLMSGANAIHGVILLGAIIVTGSTDNNLALAVGLVAIVLAAINMVGGFLVTDRMLQMFVRKKPAKQPAGEASK